MQQHSKGTGRGPLAYVFIYFATHISTPLLSLARRRFRSYSKYPPCYKDVAFWVSDAFTENNLCEVVRGIAGDLAEEVKLIDNFTHPKTVGGRCGRARQ